MADFPDIILTNKGLNMVALAQAGKHLIFTKIVLGNAVLEEDTNIQELTDVISPKLDLAIASVTIKNNGQVDIEARVNNAGLEKGFFCRECGVYAKIDEDGTEQLYSYTNAGSLADYLPPNTNAYSDIFVVSTVVGNSTNVQLVVDDTVIYATNDDLKEHNIDVEAHSNILSKAVPAGTVIYFASSVPPENYLKCNGAEVLRNDFASLFSVIGTTFGVGDGATTFNLPDLRGEFIRGWDDERKIDEDRVFGSWQEDNFKSHQHNSASGVEFAYYGRPGIGANGPTGLRSDGLGFTSSTGENETRPRNVALLACIKY